MSDKNNPRKNATETLDKLYERKDKLLKEVYSIDKQIANGEYLDLSVCRFCGGSGWYWGGSYGMKRINCNKKHNETNGMGTKN